MKERKKERIKKEVKENSVGSRRFASFEYNAMKKWL